MADLNIRNIDVTLVTSCKMRAIEGGQTLRDWVVSILKEASDVNRRGSRVEQAGPIERGGNGASVSVLPNSTSEEKLLHSVQLVRDQLGEQRNAPTQLPELGPADCAPGTCPHGKTSRAYCRATGGEC